MQLVNDRFNNDPKIFTGTFDGKEISTTLLKANE